MNPEHNTVTPPSGEPGPPQQSQAKNKFTNGKIINRACLNGNVTRDQSSVTFVVEKITKEKGNAFFFIFKELLVSSSCFLVQLDFAEELPVAKTGHRLKPLLAESLDDVVLIRFNYEYQDNRHIHMMLLSEVLSHRGVNHTTSEYCII